jgi:putative aldouronate transport system permease protein
MSDKALSLTAAKGVATGRPDVFSSNLRRILVKDFKRNRYIYLMLLPVVLYYLVFYYVPIYGAQIAFRDFNPARGIWDSPWVGLRWFNEFFNGFYFWRLVQNTFFINVLDLAFGFPAPIILALLLNEIRNGSFKRAVQTITYTPHFISLVVVVGMMVDFLARDGLVNNITGAFGAEHIPFMQSADWFRALYVGSGMWQQVGWGSIIYLAAMSGIDPALYEASMVDGAGRFRQLWHITLPGIVPIILILLILRMGAMMTVGYEKVILMYNPMTYETGDVISTYVFRKGILETNYSYSAAVGLVNSVINFSLLVIANALSRRVNQTSLW